MLTSLAQIIGTMTAIPNRHRVSLWGLLGQYNHPQNLGGHHTPWLSLALHPRQRWDLLLPNSLQQVTDNSETRLCFTARLLGFWKRNVALCDNLIGEERPPFPSPSNQPLANGISFSHPRRLLCAIHYFRQRSFLSLACLVLQMVQPFHKLPVDRGSFDWMLGVWTLQSEHT